MSGTAAPSTVRVPFGSLDADYRARREPIDAAIARVLSRGRFLLGEEVESFEREFAAYLGVPHAVACASGTDAIALALAAAGAGPDDEVLLPANVCVPVIAGVRLAGARPRLADVDPATLTLSRTGAERALTPRVRFFLAVHLYGGPADIEGLSTLARERGAVLVEDCAQSLGTSSGGQRTGSFGAVAAFSFYPTKNLGAYGDAGAVATSDDAIAERIRMLRQYGWTRRHFSEVEGRNSRMDELQAAILRAKLPFLEADNERRREIARRYDLRFRDLPLTLLADRPGAVRAPHLYPVRTADRDALGLHLAGRGIETAIHYPVPLHLQPAYAFLGYRRGDFPVSERASETLLSLPVHPTLTDEQVEAVASGVREFFA
ncbi:MAG TPA: DegT/DnrJ/EryC1/StrS family aminotransferase [Thermoanaerobaculia bacterium]|nr:DegT/DnrJ/EryC1/StrS family aminotransferase [Thermoanaerobaculia bacterium]